MPRKTTSRFELHIEKFVVVAAAALVLLWFYVLHSPNSVVYEQQRLSLRELDGAILAQARALQDRMRNVKAQPRELPNYSRRMRAAHEAGLFGDGRPALPATLRRAAKFGRAIGVAGLKPARRVPLVTPLAPSLPVVDAGRSVVRALPTEPAPRGEASHAETDSVWVSIAAYFDETAQRDEMIQLGYAAGRTGVYVAGVDVQRRAIRPDSTWSPWQDVPPSRLAPRPGVPEALFDDRTGVMINRAEIERAFAAIKAAQAELMQPLFHDVVAGDRPALPMLPGIRERVAAVRGYLARRLAEARRALKSRDLNKAAELARLASVSPHTTPELRSQAAKLLKRIKRASASTGGTRPRTPPPIQESHEFPTGRRPVPARTTSLQRDEPEQIVEYNPDGFLTHPDSGKPVVRFFDETAQPGRTYQYRMRVRLWNRYVGRVNAVEHPEQAALSVLAGQWSPPSDPVRVPPDTYFFVTGRALGRDAAGVEIWKWRAGTWLRASFDVGVGEVIGGVRRVKLSRLRENPPVYDEIDFNTGATVLDLRFDVPVERRMAARRGDGFAYQSSKSLVLTYLDPQGGWPLQRTEAFDKYDPVRRALRGP